MHTLFSVLGWKPSSTQIPVLSRERRVLSQSTCISQHNLVKPKNYLHLKMATIVQKTNSRKKSSITVHEVTCTANDQYLTLNGTIPMTNTTIAVAPITNTAILQALINSSKLLMASISTLTNLADA